MRKDKQEVALGLPEIGLSLDELVRQVGTRLSALLRDTDTVARIGGDEFAIVLPQATADSDLLLSETSTAGMERGDETILIVEDE